MFDKELDVPYLTQYDEPSISLVRPGYREKIAETKVAPEIYKELEDFKGTPGKSYMLVVAVSPVEYWGDNKNKDAFTEDWLKKKHHTFTQDGTFYKNHVNKDPSKNYGDNELSWYDDLMKRVLVLIGVDHDKAPDIVNDLELGKRISVSMGCLKADAPILTSDWDLVPISEISDGTDIINALGEVSSVDYKHSHKHNGTWYDVKALGVKDAPPTTEEHPWLVLPLDSIQGNLKDLTDGDVNPIWKRADELELGDYVGTPILKGTVPCAYSDEFVRMLGFYISDGWLTSSSTKVSWAVNFTVNHKQAAYIKEQLPSYKISERPHPNSKKAVHLYVHKSNEMAQLINGIIGRGANTKKISPQIMRWPVEKQLILLGAMFSGDGGTYKSCLYYSTANYRLAQQLHHIMLRCGMITSINKINHKPSTIVKNPSVEYQVWCGKSWSRILIDHVCDPHLLRPPIVKDYKRFILGGYLWSPIKDITTTPCDNEEVYNIAVDSNGYDSDSYIVNNIALHNCRIKHDVCSICGNKAPTREQYCDHMKKTPGKILPDGRKVFVYNPDPTFFDLSKVIRPAGHIEYMIKHVKPKSFKEAQEDLGQIWTPDSFSKVASEEDIDISDKLGALDKVCTIYKVINGDAVGPEEMDPKMKSVIEKSDKILNITDTKDIDTETLDEVSKCPLKNIMSTSNLLGIKFKLPELVKIIMNRMGESDVSGLMGSLSDDDLNPASLFEDDPFTALKKRPHIMKIILKSKIVDGDLKDVDEKVASLLTPWVSERSLYPVFVEKRAFSKEAGNLDMIPAFDTSGGKYLTTQESIDRTHEMSTLKNVAKALGLGTALAATSAAALKFPVIGGKHLLPASIFGTLLGANALNKKIESTPRLSTLPPGVSLGKVGSLLDRHDWERLEKVANEYQTSAYEVGPMAKPGIMDRTVEWAQENPEWAALGGLFTAGLGLKGGAKLYDKARPFFSKVPSTIVNPNVKPALQRSKDMKEIARFLRDGPLTTGQKIKNFFGGK